MGRALLPIWRRSFGRQGAHREVESEGLGENRRVVVVIGRSYPKDEPLGQSWGMAERAL